MSNPAATTNDQAINPAFVAFQTGVLRGLIGGMTAIAIAMAFIVAFGS